MVQVDVQRAVALAVHLPIAGIIPFLRPVHKPPFDRVGVDVTDAVDGRRMGKDVAVIAAAVLPEAVGSVFLAGFEAFEHLRAMLPQPVDRPAADALFDAFENRRDRINFLRRINQQMQVFGHEHIRPNVKAVGVLSRPDGLGQIAAKGCVLEQRDAAITAKRQFVAVAGHVVAFASLFDFVSVFQLHTACLLPGTHKLRLKVPHILIDY